MFIIALAALAVAALTACSSSKNNNASQTAPPSSSATGASRGSPASGTPAAGASGSPQAALASSTANPCPPQAAGTPAPATLSPIGTPNAQFTSVVTQLTPLMLQTSDLPAGERDFQAGPVVPVNNEAYVQGRPDAACLLQQLNQMGRIGGVTASWTKVGQYQVGQSTEYAFSDVVSEFDSPAGAKQGLDFIFSQLNQAPPPGQQLTTAPLDAGSYGDMTRALRVDSRANAAVNGPNGGTPTIANVRTTYFVVAWQQGKLVCTLQLIAVEQDPSLIDLKTLAQTQATRLKNAGF